MDLETSPSVAGSLIVAVVVLLGTAAGAGAVLVDDGDASVSTDSAPTATTTAIETPTPTETPTTTVQSLEITDAAIASSTVREGESVTVVVELVNRDERDRQELVELRVDGRLVATKGVDIDADETATVSFERQFDRRGEHEITVEETTLGTVTVVGRNDEIPTDAAPAVMADGSVPDSGQTEVVAVRGLADWVRSGFNASVELTVVNRGNTTVTETVEVTVDQEPVANETLRVTPGERTTATIEFLATEGTVRVEGIEAGTLSVGDSWTAVEDSERQTTTNRGPGFGGVGAVAAIVVAVVALRRRRGRGE